MKLIAGILVTASIFLGLMAFTQEPVEKPDDQATLARLILESVNDEVRRNALRNLTDQELLAKVAFEDRHVNTEVQAGAVEKLTDQKALRKLALESQQILVRVTAVRKLTDRKLLIKVVREDADPWVRTEAEERLLDPELTLKPSLVLSPARLGAVTGTIMGFLFIVGGIVRKSRALGVLTILIGILVLPPIIYKLLH